MDSGRTSEAGIRADNQLVMRCSDQRGSRLRTLLVLGRVSNLPTVWSNCLAGWLLTGEPLRASFGLFVGGATFLYTGGMFLNDACDEKFDREHRSGRPIPRGLISARVVWILAGVQLVAGMGVVAVLGGLAARLALGLVAAIVAYNLLHKKWAPSLLLMALCRSLVYLIAAAAAAGGTGAAIVPSAGVGLYVLGISLIARVESGDAAAPRWPLALLMAPVPMALWQTVAAGLPVTMIAGIVLLLWVLWAVLNLWSELLERIRAWLSGPGAPASDPARLDAVSNSCRVGDRRSGPRVRAGEIGALVARLIAGVVLVDFLFVAAAVGPAWSFVVFPLLFALALLLQKRVPAT